MNVFKDKCINLRKSGFTLNEISKLTDRPKTSVYAHIKHIPLSKQRVEEIRQSATRRARKAALARKGKSDRKFSKFEIWNQDMVCLASHLIFDGSITRSSCIYNNRNTVLLKKVEESMNKIYSHAPIYYTNPLTRVSRISYHNVALASYLKTKTDNLLKEIESETKKLKREFLISFFDDEGCIDFRPTRNRRQIRGYQKDIRVLEMANNLLRDFGIESRVIMPNEVVITGKENLMKFQKEINFSEGVYINGNRTNSRWKKNLEKRALLNMALNSFKR